MNFRFFTINLRLLLAALTVLLVCGQSLAVQVWNDNTGSWFDSLNWTPIGVPNSTQTASINNGGTATGTVGTARAFQIDVGKNGGTGSLEFSGVDVELQSSLDLGDVEATFATGGVDATSNGTASLTNAAEVQIGLSGMGDINVGQTSAGAGSNAEGTADFAIQNIETVVVAGDFDLGQTSGSGTATGFGTANISGIPGLLSVGGDFDVGQTSAIVGGVNSGRGILTLDAVEEIQVAADIDVGQATGDGAASAFGSAMLAADTLVVGDSLDVAKIRAFTNANNSGDGSIRIADATVSIGFGSASPGSIEISRVLVSESARGQATGSVIFDGANVDIANDVIVGELALGGTNSLSSSSASLILLDSKLDTRDLSVASRLDSTAGSVSGIVDARRSLVVVQSLLSLSQDATLRLHIDGTTRALGGGLTSDYSAIDADLATLGGALELVDHATYAGPAARGQVDEFQLITTLFGITGSFDSITFDGVPVDVDDATYVGETEGGEDGLFMTVTQTPDDLLLSGYLALPGDANGDRSVDASDFNIWNSNKFRSGTDWSTGDFTGDGVTDASDFNVWNSNKFTSVLRSVPEPAFGSILPGLLFAFLLLRRNR